MGNNKTTNTRLSLFFIAVIFIIGNISFYLQERSKWLYEGQPYPEAKEWLIPANIMLVYGVTITKLPFIDERSFIMKPIIGLQDYFVSKWQENLPNNDAEKYLGWYFFKYTNYIVPNSSSVVMYYENRYSYDETREALEQMWTSLEQLHKYEAKDKEFAKMRFAAFNNLSLAYMANDTIHWYNEVKPDIYLYDMNEKKTYELDKELMLNDKEKMERYMILYDWINDMNQFYEKNYPDFYGESRNKLAENTRISKVISAIMFVFNENKTYENIEGFCDVEKNIYLKEHIKSKKNLIDLLQSNNQSKIVHDGLKSVLKNNADEYLNQMCDKSSANNTKHITSTWSEI